MLSPQMASDDVRRFVRAGRAGALCAIFLILFGIARVLWLEKGVAYYSMNGFFWAKMACLPVAFVLAIALEQQFKAALAGKQPGEELRLPAGRMQWFKRLIHWQLILIGLMVLAAVWMARGVGMF